jgi:hypothetical protein
MSTARTIGLIIVTTAFLSLWLWQVRRREDSEDMVNWAHIAAASVTAFVGFAFTSGLGLLYNIMLGWSLGWLLGTRWSRMRIRRSREASARAVITYPSGLRLSDDRIILPLPLVIDCLIALACAAIGVFFGLGIRAVNGVCPQIRIS